MMEQSYQSPDPYPRAPSRLCSQSRLMDYFTSPLYIEGSNGPRDFNSYKKHSSDWDIVPAKLKQEPISQLCDKYRSKDTSELIKEQNEKSRNMSNSNSDPNLKNYNKRQMSKYTNKTSRIDLPIQDQEPHSNNCLSELEAQKSLSAQRTAAREALIQRSSVERIIPRRQSLESPVQRGVSLERPPRPPSSQRESTPQRLSRDSSLSRPFSRESSVPRPVSSQRERQGAFTSQKGFCSPLIHPHHPSKSTMKIIKLFLQVLVISLLVLVLHLQFDMKSSFQVLLGKIVEAPMPDINTLQSLGMLPVLKKIIQIYGDL